MRLCEARRDSHAHLHQRVPAAVLLIGGLSGAGGVRGGAVAGSFGMSWERWGEPRFFNGFSGASGVGGSLEQVLRHVWVARERVGVSLGVPANSLVFLHIFGLCMHAVPVELSKFLSPFYTVFLSFFTLIWCVCACACSACGGHRTFLRLCVCVCVCMLAAPLSVLHLPIPTLS